MPALSPYTSVSETRAVLERHGLGTKHALGQNFLVSNAILEKIVNLSQLSSADDVLEIGPGIGTLTVALLQTAHSVISIEFDPDLPPVLAETTAPWAERFALIKNDALAVSAPDITQAFSQVKDIPFAEGVPSAAHVFPNKLIANLPYAVAATVVLDYFERFPQLESMTVMVQKEVADRMMAQPGVKDYGAFTVKLGMYAQAAGRFPVSPNNFFPPPRVDSAVIRLVRRTPLDAAGQPAGTELIAAACTMAEAAFATRRKTLSNSCKTYFAGRGQQGAQVIAALPEIFEQAGIDARRRGETLSQAEFLLLGRAYLKWNSSC